MGFVCSVLGFASARRGNHPNLQHPIIIHPMLGNAMGCPARRGTPPILHPSNVRQGDGLRCAPPILRSPNRRLGAHKIERDGLRCAPPILHPSRVGQCDGLSRAARGVSPIDLQQRFIKSSPVFSHNCPDALFGIAVVAQYRLEFGQPRYVFEPGVYVFKAAKVGAYA